MIYFQLSNKKNIFFNTLHLLDISWNRLSTETILESHKCACFYIRLTKRQDKTDELECFIISSNINEKGFESWKMIVQSIIDATVTINGNDLLTQKSVKSEIVITSDDSESNFSEESPSSDIEMWNALEVLWCDVLHRSTELKKT